MNKSLIAVVLLMAASSAEFEVSQDRGPSSDPRREFGGAVTLVNAPGGAYIQCDPRNPSSPVRCKPDGW